MAEYEHQNIPEQLREHDWATYAAGDLSDQSPQCSFGEAVIRMVLSEGTLGLAFVLSETDGIVVVHIKNCVLNGTITDAGRKWIDHLGSYTEYAGDSGIYIICSSDRIGDWTQNGVHYLASGYSVPMTGRRVEGTSAGVRPLMASEPPSDPPQVQEAGSGEGIASTSAAPCDPDADFERNLAELVARSTMEKPAEPPGPSEPTAAERPVDAAILREEWAAKYVKAGWHVFPVKGKAPATGKGGYKNATLDSGSFDWNHPITGVAIATGFSGLVVVDCDSEKGHAEFLALGDPECKCIARTPGPPKGWHYVYTDPESLFISKNKWRHKDIDIKAVKGYVVAPSGGPDRTWQAPVKKPGPPPECLAALLPRVMAASTRVAPAKGLVILVRHGWTYVGASNKNLYYRRPGKEEGKSATWDGHVLYVHTPNAPPFEKDVGYSREQVYELLEGPKSEWRKGELEKAWEDQNEDALFELLGGASAVLRGEYRGKWKGTGRTLGTFDTILKEAEKVFKAEAKKRKGRTGQLLQKEYPALFKAIDREVRRNDCNRDIEINGEYWDDESWHILMHDAKVWAQDRGRSVTGENMQDALYAVAAANAYNPLKEYLEGLPETSGTVEMDKVFSCFISDDPGVRTRMMAWAVGVILSVYDPSYQNPMLVFQGPQGVGKSYFPEWLCKDIPEYHHAKAITPGDKDCELMQSRSLIWEVEELEGTTSKRSLAGIKAFLTRTHTWLRAPYGKKAMRRTVIANYMGTVNQPEFLSDVTGNRRFLVCPLRGINHSYSGEEEGGFEGHIESRTFYDYDAALSTTPGAFWAEALALWRKGEEHWQLTYEQRVAAERSATQALDTSDVDPFLFEVIKLTDDVEDVVWLNDIVRALREQEGVRTSNIGRLKKSIVSALKKVGRGRQRERRRGPRRDQGYFEGVLLKPGFKKSMEKLVAGDPAFELNVSEGGNLT